MLNKSREKVNGFMIINKPSGPTSHDVINRLRRITGLKKIGHAGTLDPFASGVLVVGIGRAATKQLGQMAKTDKEYIALLQLSAESDTYDCTGKIKPVNHDRIARRKVAAVLAGFTGSQEQVPPMYSAKKIKGRKLYELARAGQVIARSPRRIKIHGLNLLSYRWPHLKVKVKCSSGTYIRTLAHDIGRRLGSGAYLAELVRTAVGRYKIEQAVKLAGLNEANWQEFIKPDV